MTGDAAHLDESIFTAYIGFGPFGRELGKSLPSKWKADYPLTVHLLARSDEIDDLEMSLQDKDLVFLGCDDPKDVEGLIGSIWEKSSPFMVLVLSPLSNKDEAPSLNKYTGILSSPSPPEFPPNRDPVSVLLSSLVESGLIGIDLADIRAIADGKRGIVHFLHLQERLTRSRLEKWLDQVWQGEPSGVYAVIEHRVDANLNVAELDEFAEVIRSRSGRETEVFFSAPFSSSPYPISITLVLFRP